MSETKDVKRIELVTQASAERINAESAIYLKGFEDCREQAAELLRTRLPWDSYENVVRAIGELRAKGKSSDSEKQR